MDFFHNINKRLAEIAKTQSLTESAEPVAERATGDYSAKKARAGKDIGKPGKMFSKIAKSAGERYGSKERGEKVAGAVLAKLRGKNESAGQDDDVMGYLNDKLKDFDAQQAKTDESALQAYLGKKKYGDKGMKALQKAGREGAGKVKMDRIRAQYDKMDEEMADEGNAFTAKLKSTPKGGKFELDGKTYKDTSSIEEKKESKKSRSAGTAFDPEIAKGMFAHKDEHPRHDVKDTGYSKRYTRKEEPETKDDEEVKSDAPKKKGRPKGKDKGDERVTKGSHKYKMVGGKRVKKEKTDENLDTDGVMMTRPSNMSSEDLESIALVNKGEYDQEGEMAKDDLESLAMAAKELHGILGDDENLPEWVQAKITKALDYINSSNQYMHQQKDHEPVAEKAVSVAQRRAAGIAHAAQKGEIPKSELRGASKEMSRMTKGELHKFAATKEKGLPKKVKEEGKPDFLDLDKDGNKTEPMKQAAKQDKGKGKKETDEGAMSGAEVKDVKNPAPKSKGNVQFGKGIYESLDKKFQQALTEGMNISVNMNTGPDGQPTKNITVSAEGEDAEALAALLKMAGIGHSQEACSTCGKANCGCEELDENSPDWPTNTEEIDADPNLRTYSGGLNGPKSTGQSTTVGGGIPNYQARRQVSMEESVKLERSLFKLYQNYKAK